MLQKALGAPTESTGSVLRGPFGAPQDEDSGLLKQAFRTLAEQIKNFFLPKTEPHVIVTFSEPSVRPGGR
jgi:hypothetical protein